MARERTTNQIGLSGDSINGRLDRGDQARAAEFESVEGGSERTKERPSRLGQMSAAGRLKIQW